MVPPPDDPILPDTPVAAAVAQTPPSQSTAPVNAAPAGITREEVASLVTQGVREAIASLQQANQPAPAPVMDDTEEEFANRFYKGPKQALQEEFAKWSRPLVAQTAEMASGLLVEQESRKVDSKYGPGTWDALFAPKLNPVFEHLKATDPAQLTNRRAIENAIKTVTGENLDTLVDRMAAHKKAVAETETSQRAELRRQMFAESGNLTGGIRASDNGKPSLTEEQKQILADMKKADPNVNQDPDLLAAMMGAGDTIDDFRAAKKSLNGSGKGSTI